MLDFSKQCRLSIRFFEFDMAISNLIGLASS